MLRLVRMIYAYLRSSSSCIVTTKGNVHNSYTLSDFILSTFSVYCMPGLHLPRSSYNLFVYDFPYDFFGIVGGYKLRRMRLHCLRSPYDFFRRQTRKNLTDLADIVRLSYNHRVIFTTSHYKSHDARTMTMRKSQGAGTLTVQ